VPSNPGDTASRSRPKSIRCKRRVDLRMHRHRNVHGVPQGNDLTPHPVELEPLSPFQIFEHGSLSRRRHAFAAMANLLIDEVAIQPDALCRSDGDGLLKELDESCARIGIAQYCPDRLPRHGTQTREGRKQHKFLPDLDRNRIGISNIDARSFHLVDQSSQVRIGSGSLRSTYDVRICTGVPDNSRLAYNNGNPSRTSGSGPGAQYRS